MLKVQIVIWLTLISPILPTNTINCQSKKLVWSDEFDSQNLDTTKWEIQIGNGCPELCGWGNRELQYYTAKSENVSIDEGYLKIAAQEEFFDKYNYTSARIRSKNKGDWTYGRFEARIKLPTGKGIWPAFWMLPSANVYGNWPKSGEIDIMECVGHEPQTIHGTMHYGQFWPNNKHKGKSFSLDSQTFADDFYVFAIEWESNSIKWFVDNQLYQTITTGDITPSIWPFNQNFHFLLNVAVGGTWPGSPDAETNFPQEMLVDYVRVYQ